MRTLSVCSICQDEQEVIGWFLDCCVDTYAKLGPDVLKEVVIVDGGSIDNTVAIIKSYGDRLPLLLLQHPFDTFGKQKNRALDYATGAYVFAPDTDMTWTTNFAWAFQSGLYDGHDMVDFSMLFTADDEYHFFDWPRGVNMRLWENKGQRFVTGFHEKLAGQHPGLMVCPAVVLFENSMRQSDKALMNRGERYQKFQAEMAAEGGGPGPVDRYFNAKHSPERHLEMPDNLKKIVLPQQAYQEKV